MRLHTTFDDATCKLWHLYRMGNMWDAVCMNQNVGQALPGLLTSPK